jgi:hypothetical protein
MERGDHEKDAASIIASTTNIAKPLRALQRMHNSGMGIPDDSTGEDSTNSRRRREPRGKARKTGVAGSFDVLAVWAK